MYVIVSRLVNKILDDENIEQDSALAEYISKYFLSRVYIFNEERCLIVRDLLKEMNYDVEKIKGLVECAYWIRNSISKPRDTRSKPSLDYLRVVKNVFETLGMDYTTYNTYYAPANHAVDKVVYSFSR